MSAEEKKRLRVTLQVVGPITRSTLDSSDVPADEQALNDARHWAWGTATQLARFRRNLKAELKAFTLPSDRRSRVFSRTSFDEHMLLVAAGQLQKALKSARNHFPHLALSGDLEKALRLLRNIYEHWDALRESFRTPDRERVRSARQFSIDFPEGQPWSVDFMPNGDIVLAKVVSLRMLASELGRLQRQLSKIVSQRPGRAV
jgi:hypothetical protein